MKQCTKCKQIKSVSEFCKHNRNKDGLSYDCKDCKRKYDIKYRKENIEKRQLQRNKYNETHKKNIKQYFIKFYKDRPWYTSYAGAKQRCNNSNNPKYHRYGGRNIKFIITQKEVKELWFRDKAYLMKQPSIDRIDNDGNYEYSNCRFIEMSENSKKIRREEKERR